MSNSIMDQVQRIFIPAYMHRRVVVLVFVIISSLSLFAGYHWPKKYTSFTTIFIQEENILGPLMQGTAVQGEVIDQGRIAREIVFGRKIMMEIISLGGWMEAEPGPAEQEQLMEQVRARTTVSNVGENLVKISYNDVDANRAYVITKGFADLFIKGSLNAKVVESRMAFEFINNQALKYEEKLRFSEDALKKFRAENVDFRTGAATEVNKRITQFRSQIEGIEGKLVEADIKKKSLTGQLSGETETAVGLSRAEQFRSRIAGLQVKLDTRRLSYHETYPDIVQLKQQIVDLRESLVREEKRRKLALQQAKKQGQLYIDESVRANPIYQQLQGELYQTKTLIATLKVRLKETHKLLQAELGRDGRINEAEATLTSLNRDYEANRNTYRDLSNIRENARVSMNLALEHQGLSLSINEPAYFPHKPSGPRFFHIVLVGLILGVVIPIGVLFGIRKIMPRIYSASDIENILNIKVIGEFNNHNTPQSIVKSRRDTLVLSGIVLSMLVAVAATLVMRVLEV